MRVAYADGATTTYDYDPNGNLITRTDSDSGTSTYSYDAKNRLTSQNDPGPASTTYAYDSADNLTTITDAHGTATYAYDALNRASSVGSPGGGGANLTYDGDDRQKTIQYPNSVVVTNDYDPAGHLTSTHADRFGSALSRFDYSYRQGTQDRDLRMTRTVRNGDKTTYQYDELNRVRDAETRNPAGATVDKRSYELDKVANITKRTINGTAADYTVNDADQLTGGCLGVGD